MARGIIPNMPVSRSGALIFVDRNTIQCAMAHDGAVITIPIGPEFMRDDMVINEEALVATLRTQLLQRKFAASAVLIILSEQLCFRQTLTGKTPQELEKQEEELLQALPFERVLWKRFVFEHEYMVIAVPEDVVRAILTVCTTLHAQVVGVLPQYVAVAHRNNRWLDASMAAAILKDASLLSQSISFEHIEAPKAPLNAESPASIDRVITLPRLLSAFGILLVALLVLLILRR